MPSWPHSDDNMSYHAPRRADQPLPCTTNTASYAHSPQSLPRPQHQVCSCTPSARFHGNPTYAPTTPDTQFASPTIVLLPLEFRTGLWDDDDFFRMHSAYGFDFWFLEAQSGFGHNCHAIHFTRFINNTLFPPNPLRRPFFLLCYNIVVLCRLLQSRTSPRTEYHRDGMARVVVGLFRSSNLFTTPLPLFLLIVLEICWLGV